MEAGKGMAILDQNATNRMLLIEEDEAYRYALARELRTSGLDVVEFGLAIDALDFFERNAGITMAAVSVGIPGGALTGLGLARTMRHRSRDAHVVLITALDEYLQAPVGELFGEVLLKVPDVSILAGRIQTRLGVRSDPRKILHAPPPRPGSMDGQPIALPPN
jgi:CheY-like chemotaxis protein